MIFTALLLCALPPAFAFPGTPRLHVTRQIYAPPLLARGGGGGRSGGRKGLNNRRGTYGKNGEPAPTSKRRKRNGSRGKQKVVAVKSDEESDVGCISGDGGAGVDELAFGDAGRRSGVLSADEGSR